MRRPVPLLVLAIALAGCGGRARTPEQAVRQTLERYGAATAHKDYQAICDELLDPALKANAEQYGLPCELAVKPSLEQVESPRLVVGKVEVRGDGATAIVTTTAANQPASTDTLTLRRITGEWRISAQKAAPRPDPAAEREPPRKRS